MTTGDDDRSGTARPDSDAPDGGDGIYAQFAFRDRGLYVEPADALVLADLHVGRSEASDVTVPIGERDHLAARLQGLLDAFDPATVVFAGDVLHSFSYVPIVARRTLGELVDVVERADAELRVVRGNHDPQLDAILDAPVADSLVLETPAGDVVVAHGHARPDRDGDVYVVGHQHPAIEIQGHKQPAYLVAERAYRGRDVVVLPAFTDLARGVKVNEMRRWDFDTPLFADVDAIRPIVRDAAGDDTLWFPPLDALRPHL